MRSAKRVLYQKCSAGLTHRSDHLLHSASCTDLHPILSDLALLKNEGNKLGIKNIVSKINGEILDLMALVV